MKSKGVTTQMKFLDGCRKELIFLQILLLLILTEDRGSEYVEAVIIANFFSMV